MSEFKIEIMAEAGNKLTRKQEIAVENVLLSIASGTIGEKYEPVKTMETETGAIYRCGGGGGRMYFVELDGAGIWGTVSGAGMKERHFSYRIEKVDEESVPESEEAGVLRRAEIVESMVTMMATLDESITQEMVEDSDVDEPEFDTVTVYYEDVVGDDEPYVFADGSQNVELDSEGFVTWECFDTLPYLVKIGVIKVNLTYRPAFCPEEGRYWAMTDGDKQSYMVAWEGTAEQCDWKRPCRIMTLEEFNAKHVVQVQPQVKPVDLLGNRIYEATPSRQLTLFDKTEYTRTPSCSPAVVIRENGEQVFGRVNIKTPKKELMFTSHATGKKYMIPLQYCNIAWAGNAAIIDIAEQDLGKKIDLYGMFASCRLF